MAVPTKAEMRITLLGCCTTLAALVAAGCGFGGTTERNLDDRAGDGAAATGPNILAVGVKRNDETITFRVRFATAPPLEANEQEGWVDMLLIGIDVPPSGPPPTTPGGEWRGADYALGAHGPSVSGMLVRLPAGASEENKVAGEVTADIPIETDGATLSLSVPRDKLRDPETFALSIAAAREWNKAGGEPPGARPDVAPDRGTWTVELGG